jgi:hypothetical protein
MAAFGLPVIQQQATAPSLSFHPLTPDNKELSILLRLFIRVLLNFPKPTSRE